MPTKFLLNPVGHAFEQLRRKLPEVPDLHYPNERLTVNRFRVDASEDAVQGNHHEADRNEGQGECKEQ